MVGKVRANKLKTTKLEDVSLNDTGKTYNTTYEHY